MPYIGSSEKLPATGSGANVKVGTDPNGDMYKNPTHDIELIDSDDLKIGLVLCDGQGKPLPENFSIAPSPKMASKIREGRGKHDDQIGPFSDEALVNFSLGRGVRYRDEKAGAYYEGFKADTRIPGRVTIAAAEKFIPGIRHYQENWFDDGKDYEWEDVGQNGYTQEFTADDDYNMSEIQMLWRRTGTTGHEGGEIPAMFTITLKVKGGATIGTYNIMQAYYKYVDDEVGGVQTGEVGDTHNMKTLLITSYLLTTKPGIGGASAETIALTSGTTYEIVISSCGWIVGLDDDHTFKLLTDGTNAYYRVLDDTVDFKCLYFEYKGGYYCITQPIDRTASKLYLLGKRGIADSNAGQMGKLIDATNPFVADELIGGIVHITGGPGYAEEKPFRYVTDNEVGNATLDEDWIIEHTTNTAYYVEYPKWTLIKTFSYYATDAKVADQVIHIVFGQDDYHHWLRYGNDDGTWTEEYSSNPVYAWRGNHLLAIHNPAYPERRQMFDLYIARNMKTYLDTTYPNNVMLMNTPPYWGVPMMILGQLVDNAPWIYGQDDYHPNVESYADRGWWAVDVAAAFTTGGMASRHMAPAIDMSKAEMLAFSLSSTIDFAAGDLFLRFGDGSNEWDVDLPAITEEDDIDSDWKWYVINLQAAVSPKAGGGDMPDWTKIDRVILRSATDKGAYKLKFGESGFLLLNRDFNNHRYELGMNEKITNMLEYGGGSGQETKKPWVLTDKWWYYIEDGQLKPLYLPEMKELSHYKNGQAACVWDVYMISNVGETAQRYYQGRLDSIGPDVGDFPTGKIPGAFVGYAGHLFGSWGNRILVRRNSAWHELYNGGMLAGIDPDHGLSWREVNEVTTMDIRGMADESDRLYFNNGADVGYIPLEFRPEAKKGKSYWNFGPEAVIRTSTITSSKREVEKYFNAVRIVAEYLDVYGDDANASSVEQWVEISYKTSEDTDWQILEGIYDEMPAERIQFSDSYDVKGLSIELEIRLYTANSDYSPVLMAAIVENLERNKVNFSRQLQCRLYAGNDINKQDQPDDQTGEQKWTYLKTKMNSPLPVKIKMNSTFTPETYVFIEPVLTRAVMIRHDANDNEMHICPFNVTEVWDE